MTGVVSAATDGLVQHTGDAAGTEQIAGYGSQLNEAGYVVIADLVDGADLGKIARLAGGLDCDRAGTRRLMELPWCHELAMRRNSLNRRHSRPMHVVRKVNRE